jgi:DNA repair photolyase
VSDPQETRKKRGRGAQLNPSNRFLSASYEETNDPRMAWEIEEEENPVTQFIEVFPKSILSENNSPDLGFRYGINPYNGCEHGCVYCYARNSHEYWGYSAGTDFEQKIMYKPTAGKILEETFRKPSYEPDFIMFSGNTDCYQPAERRFGITRELLSIFLKYRHPVGIITKNSLILRDLDLLLQLHEHNLLRVTISITSLREETRRAMEPRTSSVKQRLLAAETLVKHGIPVNVNMAPIIMGINNDEIFDLVRTVGDLGAYSVSYIMVRLNGQIAQIFEDWVTRVYPERAAKILNYIRDTHGGALNESEWGTRMSGKGKYAEQVQDMFALARKKYLTATPPGPVTFELFRNNPNQLSMF